ncbi:MAG: two-component system, NtrC family, response regulator HydG [Thermoproteota archaeon]|nr:two-component system, NtrC family, response regulator HydG [Thermoproteota archaeon]
MTSKILVIDDEKSIVDIFRLIFLKAGYDVKVAESCEEALRIARSECFDIALIDISLPDGNGLELAKRMDEEGLTMAKVFISGLSSKADEAEALKRGCAYLLKPVHPLTLLEVIKDTLKKK